MGTADRTNYGDAPERLIVQIIGAARWGYWVALGLAIALKAAVS
jgi:hypothetical protein